MGAGGRKAEEAPGQEISPPRHPRPRDHHLRPGTACTGMSCARARQDPLPTATYGCVRVRRCQNERTRPAAAIRACTPSPSLAWQSGSQRTTTTRAREIPRRHGRAPRLCCQQRCADDHHQALTDGARAWRRSVPAVSSAEELRSGHAPAKQGYARVGFGARNSSLARPREKRFSLAACACRAEILIKRERERDRRLRPATIKKEVDEVPFLLPVVTLCYARRKSLSCKGVEGAARMGLCPYAGPHRPGGKWGGGGATT